VTKESNVLEQNGITEEQMETQMEMDKDNYDNDKVDQVISQ